jgi:hypothetical protein
MIFSLPGVVNAWRRGLSMIPVLVALSAAPSASAATPLTGEALAGGGTTSNAGGSCAGVYPTGTAAFSVSGAATGPYPGSFVESGHVSFGRFVIASVRQVYESATFTITSGRTTITGNLIQRIARAVVAPACSQKGLVSFTIYSMLINYTAVINGHTYQGTGFAGPSDFYTNLALKPQKGLAGTRNSFTG